MYCTQNVRAVIRSTLTVLLTSCIVNGRQFVENKMSIIRVDNDTDTGRATKCDPSDPTEVEFSWRPKDLSPSGQVGVTYAYRAPYDLNIMFIKASAYIHGESESFFDYKDVFDCQKTPLHGLCPMKRGKTFVRGHKNFDNLKILQSFPGNYDIIVEVKNEFHQQMLCLNISLHINNV